MHNQHLAQVPQITVEIATTKTIPNYQWEEVAALFLKSFSIAYKDVPMSHLSDKHCTINDYLQEHFLKQKNQALNGNYTFFFIRKDTTLVGYALYTVLENDTTIYILQIAVDPECQGHGIGKNILTSLESEYNVSRRMALMTRIYTPGAIDFYRRLGFYEYSWKIDGIENDAAWYRVFLQKDINPM